MINNLKILAIIPARGGSKRLPKKNILPLSAKPLISWSIESALNSKYIDTTIVSSDSSEVLNIASKYKVNIEKRPNNLAKDNVKNIDVVLDILKKYKEYNIVILLQPTSPLRTQKNIDEAIELLIKKDAHSVISLCELEHPIQWSSQLPNSLSMNDFIKNINTGQSQEQEKFYRLNGAIYITKTEKFIKYKTWFLKDNIFGYIMPKVNSIDIDDKMDFLIAETFINHNIY